MYHISIKNVGISIRFSYYTMTCLSFEGRICKASIHLGGRVTGYAQSSYTETAHMGSAASVDIRTSREI